MHRPQAEPSPEPLTASTETTMFRVCGSMPRAAMMASPLCRVRAATRVTATTCRKARPTSSMLAAGVPRPYGETLSTPRRSTASPIAGYAV